VFGSRPELAGVQAMAGLELGGPFVRGHGFHGSDFGRSSEGRVYLLFGLQETQGR